MDKVDIDEIFDFFPSVSSLLKDITTSVDDDSASAPRARDVTKHLVELQNKFSRAEKYLDNLPGGYLSSSAQLQEQDRLEKLLLKKTKFLETCLEDFKKKHENKKAIEEIKTET